MSRFPRPRWNVSDGCMLRPPLCGYAIRAKGRFGIPAPSQRQRMLRWVITTVGGFVLGKLLDGSLDWVWHRLGGG